MNLRLTIWKSGIMLAFLLGLVANGSMGQCNNTTPYPIGGITAPAPGNTVTLTTCQYASEYATVTGVAAGNAYQSNSSIATDYITVRQGTPGGPVIAFGPTPLNWTSTVAGTYYIHCNANAACGTQNTCRTTTLFAPNAPMAFSSCTTTQTNTTPVTKCSLTGHVIVGVEVVMSGNLSPMNLTQFTLRTTGSTNPVANNVAAIRVYYTGNSNVFATTTLFGTAATVVNTGISFTVIGSQTLASGTNYFWVAYDLTVGATIGNALDAQCYDVTVAGVMHNTAVKAPAGSRTLAPCPPSPGGVANNLLVWLKADAGITAVGADVTAWADQSPASTATTRFGSPDRVNAGRNYNPVILFTLSDGAYGGDYFRMADTYVQSFFCAAQLQNPGRECSHIITYDWVTTAQPCMGCAIHGGALGTGSANYGELGYGNAHFQTAGVWRRNGDPSGIAYNTQHSGNFDIVTALGTGTGAANSLLGGQQNNGTFNGRLRDWLGPVGELVLYTGPISVAEANRVESYLAIKYGITLGGNGSTTLAYRSSSATLLWGANSGYHNDVIGIGRDDNSVLLQKQSHTPDDSTRIYLNTLATTNQANSGSFATNNSFVLVGHNTGKLCATTASNMEMPAGLYSRLEREWKVVNTDFPATFNFAVKLNACAAPGSVSTGDLRLLVDNDGNFTNATVYAAGGGLSFAYSGGVISVTGISTAHIPQNGTRYITIGSVDQGTPLPIELVAFQADCTDGGVVVNWTTATETNNDHFTVERSRDGSFFQARVNMPGMGMSSTMHHYTWTDPDPEPGLSYYRLGQMDHNGTTTWSNVVPVHCSAGPGFSIFPNPATGGFSFRYLPGNAPLQVELHSITGQLVWRNTYPVSVSGPSVFNVDLEGVSEGIYFVRFAQGSTHKTLKLSLLR